MQAHTILFLAANPAGTERLAPDREARAIQVELERSGRRCFEFVTRWAAEPLDLLHELRALRPMVVHFNGGAQFVSGAALAQTFCAAGASVRLVVLTACDSKVQAAALAAHVDCVVGMAGSISAGAARSFAVGLYGGLGGHEAVAVAFAQGRAAIHLGGPEGPMEHDVPRLEVRDGVDANQLVLVADPSPPRARGSAAASIAASYGSIAAETISNSIVIVSAPPGPGGDRE